MYLNFAHRSQWGSLEFPYTTSQISLMVPYFTDKHIRPEGHVGGVGISFYGDEAGQSSNLKTYGGNASFAYNLHLSSKTENRITFGLQLGFIHKNIYKRKSAPILKLYCVANSAVIDQRVSFEAL